MTTVYISEFGEVKEAELLHETAKGYRVRMKLPNGHGYETLVYKVDHNGNHRSFLDKSEAIEDAVKYIEAKEADAESVLEKMAKKRDLLCA